MDWWLTPCLFANPFLNRFLIAFFNQYKNLFSPLKNIVKHLGSDCRSVSSSFVPVRMTSPTKGIWGYPIKMSSINGEDYQPLC